MQITRAEQLDGPALRALRDSLELTAEQFWQPLGIKRSTGYSYEHQRTGDGVPLNVRNLAFLRWVVGLDWSQPDVVPLARQLQQAANACRTVREAQRKTREALDNLELAREELDSHAKEETG